MAIGWLYHNSTLTSTMADVTAIVTPGATGRSTICSSDSSCSESTGSTDPNICKRIKRSHHQQPQGDDELLYLLPAMPSRVNSVNTSFSSSRNSSSSSSSATMTGSILEQLQTPPTPQAFKLQPKQTQQYDERLVTNPLAHFVAGVKTSGNSDEPNMSNLPMKRTTSTDPYNTTTPAIGTNHLGIPNHLIHHPSSPVFARSISSSSSNAVQDDSNTNNNKTIVGHVVLPPYTSTASTSGGAVDHKNAPPPPTTDAVVTITDHNGQFQHLQPYESCREWVQQGILLSPITTIKKRSPFWQAFHQYHSKHETNIVMGRLHHAACNLCGKTINMGRDNSTTTLSQHLKKCNAALWKELKETTVVVVSNTEPQAASNKKQKKERKVPTKTKESNATILMDDIDDVGNHHLYGCKLSTAASITSGENQQHPSSPSSPLSLEAIRYYIQVAFLVRFEEPSRDEWAGLISILHKELSAKGISKTFIRQVFEQQQQRSSTHV